MTEVEILERLRRRVRLPPRSRLVLGIGDDCAIYRPRHSPEDLLFTTDMLIEDVHFRHQTHPPEAVGHKALARSLSDIAAMGGEPRFCLVSLALPEAGSWVDGFYRGLLRLADRTGTVLAGGDLARADRVSVDVMVCGAVPRGAALRRDGAQPGDDIYISGPLGGSALQMDSGGAKHVYPEPRLRMGRWLRGRASACMDLSDGLSLDLHRLCKASGVAAEIEPPLVFPGASLEQALHGGEDYELLFTSSRRMPRRFTRIGAIVEGRPEVRLSGKRLRPAAWDHFSGRAR